MIPGIIVNIFGRNESLPPLDTIGTGATGAYGLRKMRGAYSGTCIRVRRSSDSTEQNIGFVGDLLDTTALLSFVGAGSGFVRTLHDQSGSARDHIQTTATAQPRIVNAGVLDTLNGNPTMVFDGTDDVLTCATTLTNFITASAYTALSGVRATAGTTGANYRADRGIYASSDNYFGGGFTTANFRAGHTAGGIEEASVTGVPAITAVTSHRFGGGVISVHQTGGSPGTDATAGNVGVLTGTMRIGQPSGGSPFFQGSISELIYFNSQLSLTDLNLIGPNMAEQIGVTWTTAT